MQILVSLSCTMCPDLVVAAQRIASLNLLVTAEVYDIAHFPDLKEKYNVMSVPCLIINQDRVTFGKKNIPQLLELL
ncbi:MAG: thioredoxin family protein [Ruminococcus sp.]